MSEGLRLLSTLKSFWIFWIFYLKMRIRRAQTKEEPEVRVNFRREGFEVFKDRMKDRPFEDSDDFEIDE